MNKTYKVFHLFCGIGGGAIGFNNASEEHRGMEGNFETICGIDNDPEAIEDFRNLSGTRGELVDLFDRQQYRDFHGEEPSEDWEEVTPKKLRELAGEVPDVVFTSPPCKGFSGLLSEKSSKTLKYQALNRLTVRSVWLTLEAFKDDLPSLLLLENVPRITTRGKELLDKIKEQLEFYGYEVSENYHDCGPIGGLAQHRKRFLLIARNPQKLDSFVYHPPEFEMKTIGDVLEKCPMPGEPSLGKIHSLPKLQWKTWVRLSLIPAGGDWRDLDKVDWKNIRINGDPIENPSTGYKKNTHRSIFRVQKWDDKGKTVTGANRPTNGCPCIADPRLTCKPRSGTFGVMRWDEASKTIIGSGDIHAGSAAIADPRIPKPRDRDVYVIISEDGTWHRPLTTYEMAMLQGFPMTSADGSPYEMAGNSDMRWRERIGNAVPPATAQAIADTMLRTLLAAEHDEWLMSGEDIWVAPEKIEPIEITIN